MRIAIMGHNLRVAGGMYVGRSVITALSRVAPEDEYWINVPAGMGYEKIPHPPRAQLQLFHRDRGALGQLWYERRQLPQLLRDFRPDLVWGLGNFVVQTPGARHAFLTMESHYVYSGRHNQGMSARSRFSIMVSKRRIRHALTFADLLFCQTRTMAARVRANLGYEGNLAIMPTSVAPVAQDFDHSPPAVFKSLKGKYILFCLAKYYPHKNLDALLDLMERYPQELADVVILVTVAPDHDVRAPAFLKRLEQPHLRERVINVGPVPFEQLGSYYTNSHALIMPTVLESFSATHVEAMQYGCPILTSDMDFARDVCGDAAVYFDPWDIATMKDAIVRLKTDATLAPALLRVARQRMQDIFKSWDEIVAAAMVQLRALVAGQPIPNLYPQGAGAQPTAASA